MCNDDFSIIFTNNSFNFGSVCLYQTNPNDGAMTLAWLTKSAHPTTTVELSWNYQYNSVWSETGQIKPGSIFKASQTWMVDLDTTNKVNLKYECGAFTFADQARGNTEGKLFVTADCNLPINKASVGIGMSGAALFVEQVQPNRDYIFEPSNNYWITFGNYHQGQVLDCDSITKKVQISFPPNIRTMVVTLNQDNTWSIAPF